jgi:YggT family protein
MGSFISIACRCVGLCSIASTARYTPWPRIDFRDFGRQHLRKKANKLPRSRSALAYERMIRFLLFIDGLLGLYILILIAAAVMSWLIAFDVVNIRNNIVRLIWNVLTALTEPALRPIRRYIPNLGGLDMSFLVLFIVIQFVRAVVVPNLIDVMQ